MPIIQTPQLVQAVEDLQHRQAQFDVIYPRAWVECMVIFDDGDRATSGIAPAQVEVTHNPHHTASTCKAQVNLSALTFGHRTINNIFLAAFMGVVEKQADTIKTADGKNLQFCGYVDVLRDRRSKDGPLVELQCRDLSAPFRDAKPMVAKRTTSGAVLDPTPRYSDTVLTAVRRIYQWAGATEDLLELSDPDNLGNFQLGQAVGKRERSGYLPIKRDASAWDAIEHVCALANILPVVEAGKLVFKAPHSLIGQDASGKQQTEYDFVFGFDGANVLEIEREKKFVHNRKGVKVVAHDPKTQRAFSAVWPPDSALPPVHVPQPRHGQRKKPPTPKQVAAREQAINNAIEKDRDVYTFGLEGLSSADQAQEIAKRIYLERAHQELEGSIQTMNWRPELFQLRNGARIGCKVTQRLEAELRNFDDTARKLEFLRTRLNVGEQEAQALLRGTSKEEQATPYYLRSITHRWAPKSHGTHVDFINLMVLG